MTNPKIEKNLIPVSECVDLSNFTPLDTQCVTPVDVPVSDFSVAPSNETAGGLPPFPSLWSPFGLGAAVLPEAPKKITVANLINATPEEQLLQANAHHQQAYDEQLKYSQAIIHKGVDYDLKTYVSALPNRLQEVFEPLLDQGLVFSFEDENNETNNPFEPQMAGAVSGGLTLVVKKVGDLGRAKLQAVRNALTRENLGNAFNNGTEVIFKVSLRAVGFGAAYYVTDHITDDWIKKGYLPVSLKGPAMVGLGFAGAEFGYQMGFVERMDYMGTMKAIPGFYLTQKLTTPFFSKALDALPFDTFNQGKFGNDFGSLMLSGYTYSKVGQAYVATINRLQNFATRGAGTAGEVSLKVTADRLVGASATKLAAEGALAVGTRSGLKIAASWGAKGLGYAGKAATVVGLVGLFGDLFYLGRDTSDNPQAKLEAVLWHDKLDNDHWWITTALFGSVIRACTSDDSLEPIKQEKINQTDNFANFMKQSVHEMIKKNTVNDQLNVAGFKNDLAIFNKENAEEIVKGNLAQMNLLRADQTRYQEFYQKLTGFISVESGEIIYSGNFIKFAKSLVDEELHIAKLDKGQKLIDLKLVELDANGQPLLDDKGQMIGKAQDPCKISNAACHFMVGFDDGAPPPVALMGANIRTLKNVSNQLANL